MISNATSLVIKALLNSEAFAEEYAKFNATSGPATDALVLEYLRKRNAFELSNTNSRKTGCLDIAKLPQYKVNEDIFKQKRYKNKGKNHSFDILLDWSGSFGYEIHLAIRQAIIFSDFARKIKAPFRLCAFQDAKESSPYNKGANVFTPTHVLSVLLSSTMGRRYEDARKFVFLLSLIMDSREPRFGQINYPMYNIPSVLNNCQFSLNQVTEAYNTMAQKYALCCTPLNSSLIEMRKLMQAEAKPNLIQNLIIITDGMSDQIYSNGGGFDSTLAVEDPLTRKAYSWSDEDRKKFPFSNRSNGILQTHMILKTFDWGHINKIMFFIESSSFAAKFTAYNTLTTSGENLSVVRKHFGVSTPLDISGFGYIDHCIFVDRSTYENKAVGAEINGALTAKKIAAQISKASTNVRDLQLISRRIADLVCADFTGREVTTPGVAVISWDRVVNNTFDRSEVDAFLAEERASADEEFDEEFDEVE